MNARNINRAAHRLALAAASRVPCPPIRDLIDQNDLEAAYAVQQTIASERAATGAHITGRKIGLTSTAVQQQLGVDQPDFGVLFADMAYPDAAHIRIAQFLQPRVEAEIAFVLSADLADGPLDAPQIRAAVAYATAALEICDSRIARWDISLADTVADNASAGGYVLGNERVSIATFEPADVEMSMTIDGVEVSTGAGAACLGSPLNALGWLARVAREFGNPLTSGQVILSGALGPMAAVPSGGRVCATLSGLGTVSATFIDG